MELVEANDSKLLSRVKKKVKKNLNIELHPNLIMMVKVETDMTAGGIYLPDSAEPMTPVAEIIATGSNITHWNVGDIVYLVAPYMQFAQIERQDVILTYEDGIIGRVSRTEK